jgi:hypothetical protein
VLQVLGSAPCPLQTTGAVPRNSRCR